MKDGQRKRAGWLGSQLALYFFKDCSVMHNTTSIILLACVLFGLVTVSCGLQDIPFYYAPDFSYGSNVFTLSDSGNVSESTGSSVFLGYEIFYRVYQTEDAADNDRQVLSDWAGRVGAESNALDPDDFVQKATYERGFVRIRHKSDTIAPLIKPTESNATYYLHIATVSDDWYFDQDDSTTLDDIKVCRTLDTTTSADRLSFYKLSNYKAGDPDYDDGTTDPGSGPLYFVFFAVGYWTNTDDLSSHFGAPTVITEVVQYTPPLD